MKLMIVLAFVAVVAARPNDDDSHYLNSNIDEAVNNVEVLQTCVDCFLGIGKCTSVTSDLKKLIPEAIRNDCSKCSDKQKTDVAKIIVAIKTQLPEECLKLKEIYNPGGKYDASFNEFLQKYGH